VPLAFAAAALVTALVLGGIRRSTLANTLIVGFTLLTLLVFALAGLPGAAAGLHVNLLAPLRQGTDLQSLLYASALMFVAYTGYGRVATLGEEVRDPLRTIPRAIVLTLLATMGIYLLVTAVAVGAVGAGALAEATGRRAAPLAVAA